MDDTNAGMPTSADEAKEQAAGFIAGLFDFSFKTFITIRFVSVLYVVFLVLIAIGWLIGVIAGFSQGFMAGIGGIIVITILAFIEIVLARIWLELIVVLFRIGENTTIMAKRA